MNWLLAIAATIALAVALARRGDAGQLAQAGGDETPQDEAEPDQLPGVFDQTFIAMNPTNYIPSGVTADQAQTNERAFLDMLAYSEGTSGPDGYRTLFGGSLFDSLAEHPRIYIPFRDTSSSAAGRYQILWKTWVVLRDRLGLPDFGPQSQDRAALELVRERGALNDVRAGRFAAAVAKCAPIWASLPGAGYNQPERKLSNLLAAYQSAGGTLEG